jgi:hypothetical protein
LKEGAGFNTSPSDFIIFDSNPNDLYAVAGFSIDINPYCEIYRYEIVDNTAPTPSSAIKYPSQYVTSAASSCTDMLLLGATTA